MDLTAILTPLIAHGPIGILCLVAIYSAWTKDKELKAANDARIAESREASAKILEVVGQVYKATDQLAEVADQLVKLKKGD